MRRGIEVGHVFMLGRRFTDAFGLDALGSDGRPIRITMGSYGIGISRVVATIVEQHHDERGLRVLLDDRTGLSAGVKFTDAELLGMPTIVVAGRRLVDGYVELRDRASGARTDVPLADVVDRLID